MGNAAQAGGGQPGNLMGMLPIVLMFVIFYFLLIRPQQKKAKEHKEMIANLKKGNKVVTSGGVFGTIISLDDTTVKLEIADKVEIKMTRSSIAAVVNSSDSGSKKDSRDKE